MKPYTTAARIAVLCIAVLLSGAACAIEAGEAEPLANFPVSQLQVAGGGGALHKFRIWIADTPMRRAQGLMFVRALDPDQGMLFVFSPPRVVSFWMQNTYLSLDLLFIAPDGRVLGLVENATPLSTEPMESPAPATGVLEIPGGTARRLGIEVGDRVLHPAFAGAAAH